MKWREGTEKDLLRNENRNEKERVSKKEIKGKLLGLKFYSIEN